MKNTPKPTAEQQAEHIANLCRELYKNTNDGPRLLAHVMEEFPDPRGPRSSVSGGPMSHNLG